MIRPLLFKKQAPDTATREQIAAIEAKVGFRFPGPFVEFCMRWNGGFPARVNEFYPVPPEFHEFYKEYGKKARGVSAGTLFGITDSFRQCSWLEEFKLINEGSNWVIAPISVDLFGNRVVLRPDSLAGPVYWWDHELWETAEVPDASGNLADRPRLIPIAPDLESFYNGLTSDPYRRK